MAINQIEASDQFPTELLRALNYIIEAIEDDDLSDDEIRKDQLLTAKVFQGALNDYGYKITLGQGRAIYSNYSFNKWASWLVGEPTTVEDAKLTLICFAKDVLFGENHVGYGQ
jgi:hypothetical protein